MSDDYFILSHKGQKLLCKKRYKSAIKIYEKITSLHPTQFFGWYNFAVCQLNLGQLNEALNSFLKALEIRNDDAYTLNEISLLYFKQDNLELASDYARRALKIDPNNAQVQNSCGIMEFNKENFFEAKQFFQKALELDPNFKAAKLNLKDCLEKTRVTSR